MAAKPAELLALPPTPRLQPLTLIDRPDRGVLRAVRSWRYAAIDEPRATHVQFTFAMQQ